MSSPSEIEKNNPDIYGFVIKKEKEELTTIKGIDLKIKRYTTSIKTSGIRIPLIDNTGEFFIKFNEYLSGFDSSRPLEEKAMQMWSFTTLSTCDGGLDVIEGAGFYIYRNHVIFNEEEKSSSPLDRLMQFVEYYKKRFNIRTYLREDEFEELDSLERD